MKEFKAFYCPLTALVSIFFLLFDFSAHLDGCTI